MSIARQIPMRWAPKSPDGWFLQRWYDQVAIVSRLLDPIDAGGAQLEWFGERERGRISRYIDDWLQSVWKTTADDHERSQTGTPRITLGVKCRALACAASRQPSPQRLSARNCRRRRVARQVNYHPKALVQVNGA